MRGVSVFTTDRMLLVPTTLVSRLPFFIEGRSKMKQHKVQGRQRGRVRFTLPSMKMSNRFPSVDCQIPRSEYDPCMS